jgi:uncharacterized protein (TIGR03435 family)
MGFENKSCDAANAFTRPTSIREIPGTEFVGTICLDETFCSKKWSALMFLKGAVVRPLFAVALGMMSVTLPLSAQDIAAAAKSPLYDAVSIKPNKSGAGMIRINQSNDGYSGTNVSLKMLIQYAYKLQTMDQIAGLSGWADSAGFDVNAKMDADSVEAFKKLSKDDANDQRRVMMQQMLEDRFHLKVHHENREMSVYNLVIAKGGFLLKEADPNNTYPNGPKGPDGQSHGGMMMMRDGELTAQAVQISGLINILSSQLHRQVIDKTGLTGKYDITLKYATDNPHEDSASAATAESAPSLITAVQEQLGLKLESVKGPVDTIVVDHIEQPSEN